MARNALALLISPLKTVQSINELEFKIIKITDQQTQE